MKRIYLLVFIVLSGCTGDVKTVPQEKELIYSSEQEKLLNEAFLDIVGTDLCYTLDEEYLEEANRVWDAEGEDAARKIFDKHKVKDTATIFLFSKDKFVSNIYSKNFSGHSLHPENIPHIKQQLIDNHFFGRDNDTDSILDSLKLPLKISSLQLRQTGCYEVLNEDDIRKLDREIKTFGTFNCSRIYFEPGKERACLFYERNCLTGVKCAAGELVILEKKGNKWKVSKKVMIYVT